MRSLVHLLTLLLTTLAVSQIAQSAENLDLKLRYRTPIAEDSGLYHILTREESWSPERTAIIVCDMWDVHHCLNAVRREGEFAPRLEQVLNSARKQGVTIIHAPSGCMEFYEGHAARERAKAVPVASNLPEEIGEWCHNIPAEERGKYPVDQTDGGEDDDPTEHADWAAKLEAMGKDSRTPWTRQIDVLSIDEGKDYISDLGDEIWSILEARGIKNVILTGVHTNMCVLGRPFGLRQMARNGKNVVLMRDLTDTMYNPKAWPFVSHFTGTDLIVEHIEKFVCPTITSDQLIGGESFVFKNDTRPHIVMLIGEKEYRTNETLPKFAIEQLGNDYRVTIIHASTEDKNTFPGIEAVKTADLLFVSVRRRTPPPEQLEIVREFVSAGKPVIGIRTASHAFTLRNEPAPEGSASWPEFDAEVFGGSYSNHWGNSLVATVNVIEANMDHSILTNVSHEEFTSNGSLYVVSPLAEGATPLLMGRVEGHDPEPMAWTFIRRDGGRSFYTSLGYLDDFETPAFVQMLKNAVDWAAQADAATAADTLSTRANDLKEYFHQDHHLHGTLKSDSPLPLYDADPEHLWNRLYSVLYIRPRLLPATDVQPETIQYEGGDVIEFLAWGSTEYWSGQGVFEKLNPLLDEFLNHGGTELITDPLKRVVFQHDLWAAYDHLIDHNIRRLGDVTTRARRELLCSKLAKCLQQLAVSAKELAQIPETYRLAVESGEFSPEHHFDSSVNYLPHTLLTRPEEWVEMDFYYPEMHEDIMDRFVSLHARSFFGRSYYRIFYRFPGGREQLSEYLKALEQTGINWKFSSQFGFAKLVDDAPEIPVGTEVLLMQLMVALDDQMRPVPTNIVESIQFRVFCNLDGSVEPPTNTGVGVNILDYRLKRHLLFNDLQAGGLAREPEGEPQYRVAVDGSKAGAPDWGYDGKKVLFQQCADCHMSAKLERLGVVSIPSIIHTGGFDAGAMMGVSRPLEPEQTEVRGQRVARFKSRHESYRRLLEHLNL